MNKILLVEDNAFNRDMLSRRLIKNGFQISLAINGAESLLMAKSQKPDLILMDMSLPIMDGWQATQELKRDPVTKTIPVIALTAHAMGEDKQKALDAGCDEYDTKPIELSRLLSKIYQFLE
jgi:two-component system, cell cycle response regulator DivK